MPPRSALIALDRLPFPIRSRRLDLRPPTRSDTVELTRLLQDASVHRWLLHMPYPYRLQDAHDFVAESAARRRRGSGLSLVIEERASGSVAGGIGVSEIDWRHRHAIVGYWLGRPYWGRGYATEALTRICRFSFQQLGLHRLSAYVFHPNRASLRVVRKAGFRREGRAREAFFKAGRWVDDIEFGRLRSDRAPPA